MSSASTTRARFASHSISQILTGMEKLFWPGLNRTGVSSLGGVVFWLKCLGLMNVFVKDKTAREVSLMKYSKQDDPFMRMRLGLWGPTPDLSISKQAMAAAKDVGVTLFPKPGAQKAKETVSAVLKEKRKEKAKASSKSKRKTTEPPAEEAPKKKQMALTMQVSKEAKVWFPLFFSLILFKLLTMLIPS